MTTVGEIEKAIESLPKNELAQLSTWFEKFEAEAWDKQIRQDSSAGRFDKLRADAIAEFESGQTKEL